MAEPGDRISQLYDAALRRAPEDRSHFLRQACQGDETLRQHVESLLRHGSASEHFLEQTATIGMSDTPAATEIVGRYVGPYKILAPLGAGGMGEVYRARDSKLDREVAIKILSAQFTSNLQHRARFAREARLLATLNHPHIGAIYGLEETEGTTALVLELIEGPTLAERLRSGPLPVSTTLTIARQVANALHAAHQKAIVHRDLKPANIMLHQASGPSSQDVRVKVLDFGLAKFDLAGDADLTRRPSLSLELTGEGRIVGTPAYMSPEQARGLPIDKRTDVWAFGCVLFEMLTRQRPFGAQTATDTLARILQREPDWTALPSDTPSPIRMLIQRCLLKDPAQRLSDIGEAELLIDEALASNAGSPSSAEYVVRQLARHKLGATLIGCTVALIIGTGWWTISRRSLTRPDIPAVAVLPFNIIGSGDPYLSDGLTEAVTTELGRVGGLRVIASNTAFEYRNKPTIRDVARELGVGLVVRGSVQRASDQFRIDASLIDTRDETVLWSDRYNRKATDILKVQDEISREIAGTLSKRFGSRAPTTSTQRPTHNPEAYDAYLRGLWHLKQRSSPIVQTGAGMRRSAVQEFQRAVALDPEFALARAALASAHTQQFFYDATDKGFDQQAFVEIERALAIDPNLAEAYLARAQLQWTAASGFPHETAVTDLRRAVSINPNLAEAYLELEKVYYHIGLTDRAVEAHEQAIRLDPFQAESSDRAFRALVDAGRLQEVRIEMDRKTTLGPFGRAEALVAIGELENARQFLSTSHSIVSTDPEYDIGASALLGVVYARLGRRDDAERTLAMVVPTAKNVTALSHLHHAQFNIGATLAWLGRPDQAVQWLTKAADEGYPSFPKFSTDRSLEPLKGHAGFEILIARLRKQWQQWQKTL